jgi:hypothetical protein
VVDLWLADRGAELAGDVVALACDNGSDFDYHDLPHPTHGPQRSVINVLRDFAAEHPRAQPDLNITSFVVTSREARRALDAACMVGKGWWTDAWWPKAVASGLMHIGNRSWDHHHEALPHAFSHGAPRGTFLTIDNKRLADIEIAQAGRYLREHAPNPGDALFSYPYGESNRYLIEDYFPGEDSGVMAAFTSRAGFLEAGSGRWQVPRFVCGRDWNSAAGLEAILEAARDRKRAWARPPEAAALTTSQGARPAKGRLGEFAEFVATRIEPIEGWMHIEAALLSAHLAAVQRELGHAGATLEIGVFHGKYLAALYALSQPGERVVGVDLFVGSRSHDEEVKRVHANVAAACGDDERLKVVVADSMTLTTGRLREETGGGVRFLSIDGGHTRELVLHDLEAAAPLLEPGGIMALDDAFSNTTPGVNEGIMEFFFRHRPELAPFATCYNKLFVTTPDHHSRYLRETVKFLDQVSWLPTHERTRARRRENADAGFVPELFGYEIVAFL